MRTRTPGASLRRRTLSIAALGAVALSALLAGCGDGPLTPAPVTAGAVSPAAAWSGGSEPVTYTVRALTRDVPLSQAVTRSWTIKRAQGGTLDWPEMGLKVQVPAFAFSAREMTFTVTALAGSVIAYDFGPDGSTFNAPLVVQQSLKGTSFFGQQPRPALRGAYFLSSSHINQAGGSASVSQFQPTEVDVVGAKVRFEVTHFSGYMVSAD